MVWSKRKSATCRTFSKAPSSTRSDQKSQQSCIRVEINYDCADCERRAFATNASCTSISLSTTAPITATRPRRRNTRRLSSPASNIHSNAFFSSYPRWSASKTSYFVAAFLLLLQNGGGGGIPHHVFGAISSIVNEQGETTSRATASTAIPTPLELETTTLEVLDESTTTTTSSTTEELIQSSPVQPQQQPLPLPFHEPPSECTNPNDHPVVPAVTTDPTPEESGQLGTGAIESDTDRLLPPHVFVSSRQEEEKDFLNWCKHVMGIDAVLEIQTFQYYDYMRALPKEDWDDTNDNDNDYDNFDDDCDEKQDSSPSSCSSRDNILIDDRSSFSLLPMIPVRGLAASRDIAQFEVVIRIPLQALFSVTTTIDKDPVLGPVIGVEARRRFGWNLDGTITAARSATSGNSTSGESMQEDEDESAAAITLLEIPLLAVALLHHRRLGNASSLAPYIRMLESAPVDSMPFLWNKTQLLGISEGIRTVARGVKRDMKSMYQRVVLVLRKEHPHLFDNDAFDFEHFQWAFAMVNSRYWQLPILDMENPLTQYHRLEQLRQQARLIDDADPSPPADMPTDIWVANQEQQQQESPQKPIGSTQSNFANDHASNIKGVPAHSFLAPFADLMNFGPPCTQGTYNHELHTFDIVASCSFRKGQEVTFWYSDECDHIVVGLYGFMHPMVPLCPTAEEHRRNSEKWRARVEDLEELLSDVNQDLFRLDQQVTQLHERLKGCNCLHSFNALHNVNRQKQQPQQQTASQRSGQQIQQFHIDEKRETFPPLWQKVYVSIVLVCMFVALFSDHYSTDSVMIVTLTAMLVPGIITIQEALLGFSNSGLWTVMFLFVIAEAITKTGAFGWYMTKLLGHPKTVASAQLRLMVPTMILSAFLGDTPLVVVMIPTVQQWAKNNRLDSQQLLIPLSWAAILGSTVTLIGTSTNLVIAGLLDNAYPEIPPLGLFDPAIYGLPNALIGLSYILLTSPFIIGRSAGNQVSSSSSIDEPLLLGARVTPWCPAAGRSVQRSGLRDTGGIYLVSVVRAQTGHVHRAVSGEFILNVGDILYFTGLVESFGEFCSEHGLEVLTNESDSVNNWMSISQEQREREVTSPPPENGLKKLSLAGYFLDVPQESDPAIGSTKESLLKASRTERLRTLSVMTDLIRGYNPPSKEEMMPLTPTLPQIAEGNDPHQIVIANENGLICVGINCLDRPGLLVDISKSLVHLSFQLRNTEAAVIGIRSVSLWRCEYNITAENFKMHDLDEIWSGLNALLFPNSGFQASKTRGLRVIRACVTKESRLINKTATEVEFRGWYRAAIVAVKQHKGDGQGQEVFASSDLSSIRFREGDLLILQASDGSPLLKKPPEDFYCSKKNSSSDRPLQTSTLVNAVLGRAANDGVESAQDSPIKESALIDIESNFQEIQMAKAQMQEEEEEAWRDLHVLSRQRANQDEENGELVAAAPEFLTAMKVSKRAGWIGKTVQQVGLNNVPNLVLVSVERQKSMVEEDLMEHSGSAQTEAKKLQVLPPDTDLAAGDILWFSGPASAIGDLRKIPGLVSYEHEELEKMKGKAYERRLVQAVISQKGPLVGKTVKEVGFRTRYAAAVISVQREGKRVHELPGTIKLQAGDVLLLEAGPSFLVNNLANDASFALLSEVKDSAPPRLRLLIPTLMIFFTSLVGFIAGLTTLFTSMLVAATMLIFVGVLSEQEARLSMNWVMFMTIGAAFGVGQGLVNSGVASGIADVLVRTGVVLGMTHTGVFAGIYCITVLISKVLTSTAAAALIFPIAMDAASQTGTNPTLIAFTLMIAASASFMSPFVGTTNLLIYGPGNYKYADFLYLGTPLQIILWISATVTFSSHSWHGPWILSAASFFSVVLFRVGYDLLMKSNCQSSIGMA